MALNSLNHSESVSAVEGKGARVSRVGTCAYYKNMWGFTHEGKRYCIQVVYIHRAETGGYST